MLLPTPILITIAVYSVEGLDACFWPERTSSATESTAIFSMTGRGEF